MRSRLGRLCLRSWLRQSAEAPEPSNPVLYVPLSCTRINSGNHGAPAHQLHLRRWPPASSPAGAVALEPRYYVGTLAGAHRRSRRLHAVLAVGRCACMHGRSHTVSPVHSPVIRRSWWAAQTWSSAGTRAYVCKRMYVSACTREWAGSHNNRADTQRGNTHGNTVTELHSGYHA